MSPRIQLSSSSTTRDTSSDGWNWGDVTAGLELRCDNTGQQTSLFDQDRIVQSWTDPFDALRWMSRSFPAHDGRWIGHIGYDFGRLIEPAWGSDYAPQDTLGLPLFRFHFCRQGPPAGAKSEQARSDQPITSSFTRNQYEAAVARAIQYIAEGDVLQVNLSQRFTVGLRTSPLQIFEKLRANTPARYAAFLEYGDYCLISGSPELFLEIHDRSVVTRPIKGTRPVDPGMEDELRHSAKDAAELNMIIDLERNDLGRVCELGSVRVTQPRTIERHPTVYHGVATIEGRLRGDVDLVDVLRATFPGGSVTGAPKIRAMQIIDELEPVRRNAYCGAIGFVAPDHAVFNLAIRTMTIKDGLVHIPVGGGIVADSDPALEFEETLVKSRAMLGALNLTPDDARL